MQEEFVKAMTEGDAAQVESLLRSDPTLAGTTTDDGVSPVLHALYHQHVEIARMIAGAKRELTLHEACALGALDLVERGLGNADAEQLALTVDGWTPLHLAAFFGHTAVCEALLAAGADVSALADNSQGNTPLHAAAAGGKEATVICLLAAGASPNTRDSGHFTPLHIAAGTGRIPIIKALLAAGADPDARSQDNRYPRDVAEGQGHPDAAALLTG